MLEAGFGDVAVRLNQPTFLTGHQKRMFEWSVEEASSALVGAGLCTASELQQILADMRIAAADPTLLAVMPCMNLVTGKKPA